MGAGVAGAVAVGAAGAGGAIEAEAESEIGCRRVWAVAPAGGTSLAPEVWPVAAAGRSVVAISGAVAAGSAVCAGGGAD